MMGGKRFDRINECLKLYNEEENPQHRDRFFWLRKLTKRFNNDMAIEFNLSWLVYINEIMVPFHNDHVPR